MLGLYRRERTGRGSKVSTSLMAAGAWANSVDIQAKLCAAQFPQRKPGARPLNPLIAAYPSSDQHAMIIALLDPEREFVRLCHALDEPELATSPHFATHEARQESAAELSPLIPTTCAPARRIPSMLSRKLHASVVHPGVMSFG